MVRDTRVWPFTYSYNASIARPSPQNIKKEKRREEKKEKCAVTLDVVAVAGKKETEKVIKLVTMMMMVMVIVKMEPIGYFGYRERTLAFAPI